MKKFLIVFCFILLGTVTAQCQSECALFAKINQAICNRQFDTAIVYGDSFLKTFPNSSFIDEIMFSNASSYYYLDKLFIAKNILENIVLKEGEIQGFNLILNNCQESIYQSGFSHCYWQIYNTDTLNLKKKSKILLSDIYLKQKDYRQSLDEMKNAEKWHPTQSWCGNAQIYAKYGTALRYSMLYKNLGDIDSAILVLTPYLIPIELTTNNTISDSLYSLLRLKMSKQAILDSLDNSLLHLTIDQRNVYTEWEDEFDEETGELIKIVLHIITVALLLGHF